MTGVAHLRAARPIKSPKFQKTAGIRLVIRDFVIRHSLASATGYTAIDMANHASTLEAVAEHDAGRLDRAESLYRDTLSQHPTDLAALIGLGDVLSDARQVAEAEEVYRRALAIESDTPAVAGAYDGLAAILQDSGDLDGAIVASKKAAVLRGDADDAFGVGNSLEYLGRINDAIEMFKLAALLRHDFAEAHAKAGQHLMQTGQAEAAVFHYQAAVQARPEVAELHCNLAAARQMSGEPNQALNSARTAIELKPQLAEAHNIMGAVWKERGRWADALGALGRAVQLKPDYADALNNTGTVLQSIGRAEEATAYFTQATTNRREIPQFHLNLATNLLLRGDYRGGFAEFEWRRADPNNSASRAFPQTAWVGQPLADQTLLLHAEASVAHTVLFLRYVDLVRQRIGNDARILLEVPSSMANIARQIKGQAQVVVQGEVLPNFDLHCPLQSLALIFGTTLQTIPNRIPYLQVDRSNQPAALADSAGKRRVGIALGIALGDTAQPGKKRERTPAPRLAALSELKDTLFFNLDASPLPAELNATERPSSMTDLLETAAVIQQMDVILARDNAVAHLAGAMGKKTLVLLGESPDWCWLLNRSDSPWYPTVQLFRQSSTQSWSDVVKSAAAELRA
jgi:tetratricopeptide (TPR) repeat protein